MAISITKKLLSKSLDGKHYSSATQNNQWIVIHNTGGGTASSAYNWFNNPSNQYQTSAHYCVDDTQIIQCLENNWKGHHAGGSGVKYQDKWRPSNSEDCTNSNSIGIEVADWGGNYDKAKFEKAIENAIDLTIMLMKELNIDVNHVIRHGDTQNKDCPMFIMKENKWGYFKEQLANRTGGQIIENNGSTDSGGSDGGNTGGSSGGGGTSVSNSGSTAIDVIPNVDHRYNIGNMDQVTGACLIFYPPYNVCLKDDMAKTFEEWGWDRKYHYVIDPTYDVDAKENEQDDIPEIDKTPLPETTPPSDNNNQGGGNEENNNGEGNGNNNNNNNQGNNNGQGNGNSGDANTPMPIDKDNITSTTTKVSLDKVLLIGDSLTVGMKPILEDKYPNGKAMGKGGKWATQWLEDLGSLPAADSVSCVIQWLGINGVHNNKKNIEDSQKLLTKLKEKYPGKPIYNMRIFPTGKNYSYNGYTGDWWRGLSQEFNTAMSSWCSSNGVTQIDATNGFILNDGFLDESKTQDKLHFNTAGYKQILTNIESAIGSTTPNNNGGSNNGGSNNGGGGTGDVTVVPAPKANSPAATEDNRITIKGGFEKVENRLLQCYGLEDNDKVTYINRSLFKNHPEKHNIMIACCIPAYDELPQDYEKVEKNIINSLSKILWANGLNTKDLWREFDLNRAPSPVTYLDRDKWKKLLTEIDKLVEWRNKRFGVVTPNYEKYVAQMPDIIMGSGSGGGSNSGGNDSGGSNSGGGSTPDIGGISDTAQAVWTFFTGKGFTKECTAGIMGNLQQESGMNPNSHQSGGGKGRGICQWSYGEDRFKNLQAHAASKGKEWTDLQSQLEFLDMELQGKDPTTLNYLKKYVGGYEQFKKMTDINQACKVFEDSFERAGKPMMERRYQYAKQFYDKFAGSSSTSTASYDYDIQPREPSGGGNSGGSGRLIWPVPGHNVGSSAGSKFGMRLHPIHKVMKMHNGIDIPAPGGTAIKAAAAGKVTLNSYSSSAGNWLKIDHGNGIGTVYMHMQSKSPCAVGSSVTAGQDVGKVGTTGSSTGNHLHFEVHENGKAVDPLGYTNSGNTSGSISGSTDGSGSSGGDSGGSSGSGGSGGSGGSSSSDTVHAGIDGPLVNSPAGDIKNPGPTTNEQSMGGLEHDDWGGVMKYEVAEPEDETLKKPEIGKVLTAEEYKEFCETFFSGDVFHEDLETSKKTNFRKYWELIDIYCADIEPYDKGLVKASDSAITPNDRINALTKNFTTNNENMFHYNVVESGPGSEKHCVKAADELNLIIIPEDLKCEPIYPDLVIPPNYSTADYDELAKNSIPLTFIEKVTTFAKDVKEALTYTKKFSFDYDLLEGKEKKTLGHLGPVNFLDPYPTDDKIEELEQHFPKVLIDEIESQIYSCNHPGCPIAQPMAKNFAMLQDAMIEQSKRTERRLVKLENLLSTVMRNQARLGSRVNINCVYYGGQSTFGKYKCIRCLHDNRVHDGAVVTIDQCLNCTRYEPILGQIYQILDETGLNGSIILDDMQMAYSDLQAFKKLNTLTERSAQYNYVTANEDENCEKPEETREEIWRQANYENYLIKEKKMTIEEIEKLKEEKAKKKDEEEKNLMDKIVDGVIDFFTPESKKTESAAAVVDESKYLFRMDWNPTFFNHQEPDTKVYPADNIIARYKGEEFDMDFEEELKALDPEKDKDAIEDIQKLIELSNNNWVDTREQADTVQVNKYSSENFYFDGFAEMKAVIAGSGSGTGSDSSGGSGPSTGIGGAECRSKIVEMAKQIYADCKAGKAWYSQANRTVDYNKPNKMSDGRVGYDCSSFASCCYLNAGLKSMYNKTCSGGTLMDEIVSNGGQMWPCNDDGISKASPGDLIVNGKGNMDASKMPYKASISHVMVYVGNNTVIHASSSSNGIKQNELSSYYKSGKHAFVRPKDLMDADAKASSNSGGVDAGDTSTENNKDKETEKQNQPSTVSVFSRTARTNTVSEEPDTFVTASVLGEIDGLSYVAKVPNAVCTSYYGNGETPSGLGLENGKTCASHNMPYGTEVYIPALKSKTNPEGIFTVTDTGGPTFDFDIYTSKSIGSVNADAYILSWGTGKIAPSYTWSIAFYNDDRWNNYIKPLWNKYKSMNGKLMTFMRFSQEDANIKNHKRY